MREYVEKRDGFYKIVDSRVPLSNIVLLFRDGDSPETIQQAYRSLTLEEVYGAITFYLSNRGEIDIAVNEELRIEEEAWHEWKDKNSHLARGVRRSVGETSLSR